MIYSALHIFFLLVFIYLFLIIAYLLFLSIAGCFAKKDQDNYSAEKKKIAALITSHREDEVIVNTVKSAVEHNYPADKFDVFVAADHLQLSTIDELKKLRAHIIELNFHEGSKARSLNYLLNYIDEGKYDIALVLDGDNIMMPGFLDKINSAFQEGHKAVQAHRSAKNRNTPVAILDGISEEINNHLFRRAQRSIGFSSSLIGSGMAFEFSTLKKVYNKEGILENPACDREVDFEMLKAGINIEYRDDAILLDEKVSSRNVFENQRRRWLESQLLHLKLFFSRKEKIRNKTKDYWNKLFINLLPPRIILIAVFLIIFLLCVLQYFLHINITGISTRWWIILFFVYCTSMIISLPSYFLNVSTLNAFLHLPSLLFSYLKAAFTMKSNRKDFAHTPKSYTGEPGSTNKRQ